MQKTWIIGCSTWFVSTVAFAQAALPVTVDNFKRAETDYYLALNAKQAGGTGKFHHSREPADIDKQTVVRMNRDTLYSFAIFDLAAGPATVTMPDAGKRFMSMMVVNEDHYVPAVYYDHNPHTLTQEDMGTRYAFVAVRTLVDPNDPKDLAAVHSLQNGIRVSQKDAGKHKLKVPAEVPVDAFWSVSVYNAKGFFEKNAENAYSVNNITAKKDADGGVSIQFGGCDGKVPNCLPITDGWNYAVRMYRPRLEILDKKWTFPEPKPMS